MKNQSKQDPNDPTVTSGRWLESPVVWNGAASIIMLCAALSGLYFLHPMLALLIGILLLPTGIAALVAALLTELRNKPRDGSKTGYEIKHEG